MSIITGVSCSWGGAGATWPHPSAFKNYYRDIRSQQTRDFDSTGMNSTIKMMDGARNMGGEQSINAEAQFQQTLKEGM